MPASARPPPPRRFPAPRGCPSPPGLPPNPPTAANTAPMTPRRCPHHAPAQVDRNVEREVLNHRLLAHPHIVAFREARRRRVGGFLPPPRPPHAELAVAKPAARSRVAHRHGLSRPISPKCDRPSSRPRTWPLRWSTQPAASWCARLLGSPTAPPPCCSPSVATSAAVHCIVLMNSPSRCARVCCKLRFLTPRPPPARPPARRPLPRAPGSSSTSSRRSASARTRRATSSSSWWRGSSTATAWCGAGRGAAQGEVGGAGRSAAWWKYGPVWPIYGVFPISFRQSPSS